MASSGRQRSNQALPYINAPRVLGSELDQDKDSVLVWSQAHKSVVRVPANEVGGGPALSEYAFTVGGYESVTNWFPYTGAPLSDPPIGEFIPGAYGVAAFTFTPVLGGVTRVTSAYLRFRSTKTSTFDGVILRARRQSNPAAPGAGNLPSSWASNTFTTSASFSNQFVTGASSTAPRGFGYIDVAPQINELLTETAWADGNNMVFYFETPGLAIGKSMWMGYNLGSSAEEVAQSPPWLFVGV